MGKPAVEKKSAHRLAQDRIPRIIGEFPDDLIPVTDEIHAERTSEEDDEPFEEGHDMVTRPTMPLREQGCTIQPPQVAE